MKFLFIICIIQFCYPIDVGSIEAYFIEDYQLFRPITLTLKFIIYRILKISDYTSFRRNRYKVMLIIAM